MRRITGEKGNNIYALDIETRLKVVVVVVVVVFVVVVVVVAVFLVGLAVVGLVVVVVSKRNLSLKFGQNRVNNK